jgi:hypothetical protein
MKRAARIVAVLATAVIAACFSKPGAPHSGDGGGDPLDDARNDGGTTDGPPDAAPNCGTQDNFNNALISECETWGTATKSQFATISRPSGELIFNFTASGSTSNASCMTKAPFNITKGTSIHITQYANYQTIFSLSLSGMVTTFSATYTGSMYSYVVTCTGTNTNIASTSSAPPPGWVQMRVIGTNPFRVAVELSTTGEPGTFSSFQDCNFASLAPTSGMVTLAGSGSGTTSVSFDDFNIKNCPPP